MTTTAVLRPMIVACAVALAQASLTARAGAQRTLDDSTRRPAGALSPGLRLVYESDGKEGPPWVVDSVRFGVEVGGRGGSTVLWLRTTPGRPASRRSLHVADGVLFGWDSTAGWQAQRPVVGERTLVFARPAGDTVRYETGRAERVTVGGRELEVVPTTVLTVDRTGRAVRRLRERFAPALATAVDGTFEQADWSSGALIWTVSQRFRLAAIVP